MRSIVALIAQDPQLLDEVIDFLKSIVVLQLLGGATTNTGEMKRNETKINKNRKAFFRRLESTLRVVQSRCCIMHFYQEQIALYIVAESRKTGILSIIKANLPEAAATMARKQKRRAINQTLTIIIENGHFVCSVSSST